jgi:hypothetical protein
MSKSKSLLAALATLFAIGMTLDAEARGGGGGMGGGMGGGPGAGQMSGQYGGQGNGDMTRSRVRDGSHSGEFTQNRDMTQTREMRQEQRRIQTPTGQDSIIVAQ